MINKKIPLLRLVTFIVLIVFILTFTVLLIFNNRVYSYLINEQGKSTLSLLSDSTEKSLEGLLVNVETAVLFYGDYLEQMNYFQDSDLTRVEEYSLKIAYKISSEAPQISGLYYGDINKRFGAFRIAQNGDIRMVRKDARTDNMMFFYSGASEKNEITRVVKNYDPTIRPWFKPILEDPSQKWSEVYAAYDEDFSLCFTAAKPLITDGQITGVVGMEIKIIELDNFLMQNQNKKSGVIYILNHKDEIITNSTGKNFITIQSIDPPKAEITKAYQCSDLRISESASSIKSEKIPYDQAFKINIDGTNYFGMVTQLKKPESLRFRIVTLIPESDIVGAIKENQSTSMGIIAIIFLAGILIAAVILRQALKTIREVSEKARIITDENFGFMIDEPSSFIAETHMLIEALNNMIGTIQQSYREIKANEKNFRSLVENSDAFIFNLTPSGRIMSVNESFLSFAGIDREVIIGETIAETVTDPQNEDIWNEQWKKMTGSKAKVSFSFSVRNANREQRLLNVQLIPQFDETVRMTNIIGTFTDITELLESRRQIEELLKNENERLETLIEEKTNELNETMKELMEREKMASLGSLVAGISHEINTPLGVAVTAASFLVDENKAIMNTINEGGLTRELLAAYLENANESTRIIQNNLRRAADLIASFKSISADQSTEKEERFNFCDYLQSILLMLKHEYKNTGHRITVECPEDLFLFSYPGAYSQIFTNLIMNSLIHGFREKEAGEIHIRVIPAASDSGKKKLLRIEYQDNGAGISKENLKHIFDPFFTTARGTDSKSGSGLGLNILYNLVTTKLGGTVKCKSDPGKGVLFMIEIPYL